VEDQQPPAGDLTNDRQPQRKRRRWPRRGGNSSAVAPAEGAETVSGEAEAVEAAEAAEEDSQQGEIAASDDESPAEEAAVGAETDTAAAEAQDGDADAEAEGETDEAPATETAARPPFSRRLAIAVGVAAALFVASAAFAGAMEQPYAADRAAVVTKMRVASTAANAITTLWTYNPDNMDKLPDRAAQYLSGDFEAQYRKYIDAIVAPNKQAQITNTTEVTGAAVESLDANNATTIVYTNTTSTSPLSKNVPALRYLSYRLTMKRDHARWLVTKMTTITSLDLTPQI
jgi:Mce-associated membrane protein